MDIQDIRHQKAGVIIGKNGLSTGTIKVIQDLTKKNDMVKIKILKSALSPNYSKENLIDDLISKTSLYKIEIRGFSAIVSKYPKKK